MAKCDVIMLSITNSETSLVFFTFLHIAFCIYYILILATDIKIVTLRIDIYRKVMNNFHYKLEKNGNMDNTSFYYLEREKSFLSSSL